MKPLWIPNIQCNSADRRFSECTINGPLGYGTCGSSRDILVVDCGKELLISTYEKYIVLMTLCSTLPSTQVGV